jgi:hypothetical protein
MGTQKTLEFLLGFLEGEFRLLLDRELVVQTF